MVVTWGIETKLVNGNIKQSANIVFIYCIQDESKLVECPPSLPVMFSVFLNFQAEHMSVIFSWNARTRSYIIFKNTVHAEGHKVIVVRRASNKNTFQKLQYSYEQPSQFLLHENMEGMIYGLEDCDQDSRPWWKQRLVERDFHSPK